MFLHFLAGLLLNRTFLATPGPTQRWTSLTAFPVVCVCVCVCFFFFCGGGGGGGGGGTVLYLQMVALFYDATQGASHRSLRISDHVHCSKDLPGMWYLTQP